MFKQSRKGRRGIFKDFISELIGIHKPNELSHGSVFARRIPSIDDIVLGMGNG